MSKKILAVLLSFILLFGFVSMTYAKKETKKETVKETAVEESKPAVKKVVESKSPLKEKTSVSVDAFNQQAAVRIWASNKMGIDISAGIGFASNPTTFNFNLGAGLVFPMTETERLNVYIVPGLNIGFSKTSITVGIVTSDVSIFALTAGAGIELEGFIVPEVLSIGSSVGVFIGIQSSSGNTSFIFDAARGIGIKPLIVRFYF